MSIKGSRFPYGTILRTGRGPTALIKLTCTNVVGEGPDNVHYYGRHCMGGSGVGYGFEVTRATEQDRKTWRECAKWRK